MITKYIFHTKKFNKKISSIVIIRSQFLNQKIKNYILKNKNKD